MAATNHLAAAAAAIHESDIAATRREAISDRKRGRPNLDSDFDDKPAKKTHAKVRKAVVADEAKVAAPGAINGAASTQPKRRKVEKPTTTAPAMERTASALSLARAGASPRGTPAVEVGKKKLKAAPALAPANKRYIFGC